MKHTIKNMTMALLVAGATLLPANAAVPMRESVRKELITMPFLSIFDNLSYRIEGDTVHLYGQVIRPTLKSQAANRVAKIGGVVRVDNQIEIATSRLFLTAGIDGLKALTGLRLRPVLAPSEAVQRELKKRLGVGADTIGTLHEEGDLQVVDEGSGISPGDRARIFDPLSIASSKSPSCKAPITRRTDSSALSCTCCM